MCPVLERTTCPEGTVNYGPPSSDDQINRVYHIKAIMYGSKNSSCQLLGYSLNRFYVDIKLPFKRLDKPVHRSRDGKFKGWCGNMHDFHSFQSQSERGKATSRQPAASHGQPAMARRKKCCPLSAVLISAHTGTEIHTHTHILRGKHKHACGASTCLWLGSPLHVFLFRVKQKKHNDQTVLQVVLEAQLCADCTVDVLFCLGVGGGGFPAFRCIHMEKDGNGGSKWVYE